MSDIKELIRDFKSLFNNIEKSSITAVNKAASVLRTEFGSKSPVDTGRFQKNWRLSRADVKHNVVSAVVSNPTTYGETLEFGSDPRTGPWKTKGARTDWGAFGTGRRLWSTQAMGGIITPLFRDRRGKHILDALAKDIIKGIKW